jgi:hypothetical protein
LRPAGTDGNWEQDLELARAWVAADPDHAGKVLPEFWLEQKLDRDSFLLRDAIGPIYFFKMHLANKWQQGDPGNLMLPAVRIFLQFAPEKNRISKALIAGTAWLERMLKQGPMKEYYFDSQNESLIRFSQKRLGFTREGSILRKRLTA